MVASWLFLGCSPLFENCHKTKYSNSYTKQQVQFAESHDIYNCIKLKTELTTNCQYMSRRWRVLHYLLAYNIIQGIDATSQGHSSSDKQRKGGLTCSSTSYLRLNHVMEDPCGSMALGSVSIALLMLVVGFLSLCLQCIVSRVFHSLFKIKLTWNIATPSIVSKSLARISEPSNSSRGIDCFLTGDTWLLEATNLEMTVPSSYVNLKWTAAA